MLDLVLRLLLGLPVLAVLLYVPGATALGALASRSPARHLFAGINEWIFAAVLGSFLASGLIGFLLAEVGMFHWWLLLVLVLGGSLLVALTLGQAPLRAGPLLSLLKVPTAYPLRTTDRRYLRIQQAALVGVVVVAALLFSRPAEMLRGALDSGAYINAGVALGKSGTIFQRDQLARELDNDKGEVQELMGIMTLERYTLSMLRMPAFFIVDKPAALILPQHYSLFPVWVGLMYQLFGVWGALYANPLIALLAVLAVYNFARRTIGVGPALAALLLLVLCPVTIWFARYPVSEVITGLLLFGGFLGFMRMVQLSGSRPTTLLDTEPPGVAGVEGARERWATFWAVIGAMSLGELMLARPDFIFYLAPLPAYLLYWRLTRRWQRPYTWFATILGLFLLLFAVHFFFYSFAYTLDLYHNVIQDVRRRWGPLLLALYVGVLLVVLLDRIYPRVRPFWTRAESLAARYRWVWAGVIVLAIGLYAVYHYLIGPWQPNVRANDAGQNIPQQVVTTWASYIGAPVDEGSRYNLLRIGWYLSPFGILLGVAGLLRWVWDRLNAATGLFFASFCLIGYVFIQETYTEAHYIYSMRRYVPVILPGMMIGVAWAVAFIWTRLRPRMLGYVLAGLSVVALAGFFLYTSRVIIPHVEERGAVAQLTDLAGRFDSKTVVVFSDGRDEPYVVATPLQYIFGIESFVLRRSFPDLNNKVLDTVVQRWQKQGYKVVVMMGANGGKLSLPGYSFKPAGTWEYRVPELEQLRLQKPSNPYESYLPWGIYTLEPRTSAPAWPLRINFGNMDYPYLVAGFNTQERDPATGQVWRWTGDQAVLRVPWPAEPDGKSYKPGTVRLRISPEPLKPGEAPLRTSPVTVTLGLDDTPVTSRTPGPLARQIVLQPGSGFQEYTVTLPAGVPKTNSDAEYALLRIASPTWSGRDAGISYDVRALGVQLASLELVQGP